MGSRAPCVQNGGYVFVFWASRRDPGSRSASAVSAFGDIWEVVERRLAPMLYVERRYADAAVRLEVRRLRRGSRSAEVLSSARPPPTITLRPNFLPHSHARLELQQAVSMHAM